MSVMGEVFSIIYGNIKKYNLKEITKVVVRVGEMTCINDDALRFAFHVFSENTIAEEAEFVINRIEARAKCDNCGKFFSITYTDKLCPFCDTYSNNITNGYELFLDKIEGEADEDY